MAVKKKEAEEAIGQNELSSELAELTVAPPLIYQKMADVMKGVDAVVKKKQGSGVNYAFRSIEDVMNSIHPVLAEHQVFLVPTGHELINNTFEKGAGKFSYQAILKSSYRFYTVDGSFIDASMVAESIDYSDKATQQASSYIYKNLILQTFCVPTRELMGDGDDKAPDRAGEKPATAAQPAAATRQQVLQDTRLSDRPPVTAPAVPEVMPTDGWQKVKDHLAQFNMSDNAWYAWTVEVLKQHGFPVPPNLAELPKVHGAVLFRVAKASNEAKTVLYKLPEAPAEAPAPPAAPAASAAPPSVPTHAGMPEDELD